MDTPNEISSRRARASARSTSRVAALSLERTVTSFEAELRDEVDPTQAQAALPAAVDSASRPRGIAEWIRGESR